MKKISRNHSVIFLFQLAGKTSLGTLSPHPGEEESPNPLSLVVFPGRLLVFMPHELPFYVLIPQQAQDIKHSLSERFLFGRKQWQMLRQYTQERSQHDE